MAQDIKRIGIIGGGAAGLFAACLFKKFAVEGKYEVTLLEKNDIPGKKLILTGHGRCNITNRKYASDLKTGYHEAENFIYPALKEFGPEDTISFIENDIGLKTKEEDNNRIFPVCDSAVKVRDSLVSYISDSVKTVCNAKVLDIRKTDVFQVSTADTKYRFDCVILSCGGSSFQHTGSTGDSYKLAGKTGHTVVTPRAALAPIKADEASLGFMKDLSGVSVTSKVSLYCSDKKTASVEGEILFADFGLTGPAVMEISREVPVSISDCNAYLELDLIPSMTDELFDQDFQKQIADHADTKITTILARYIPVSVAGAVAAKAGITGLYAQGFTKDNRRKLIKETKHLRVGIGREPSIDKAYVTRGGVSLKEVDRKTMQSRIVPGLYILGEALDIDGISGGYNLQACMSEAYLAVKDILEL